MTAKLKYSKSAATALIALAAALLQPVAQAQPAPASGHGGMSGMSGMSGSSAMAGEMDMKTMMKDMSEKMATMPMTNNPDVDFATMMRVHHVGAIDMAEEELRSGKEPQMRKMAKEIIAAQKKEIAQIDKFLAQHGDKSTPVPAK